LAVVVNTGVLKLSAKRMVWPATVSVNTTLVPVVTALLKVAPLLFVKVSVLNGAVLPIAPLTNTTPFVPALSVTDWPLLVLPFKVFANVMFAPAAKAPLLVVSKLVLAAVTTASSAMTMELGLLVRTKPPLKVLVPAASVSKCAGAVTEPMAPV